MEQQLMALIESTVSWGKERNLIHIKNADKQYYKIIEEIGEFCRSVLKSDEVGVTDGLGDIFVTIILWEAMTGGVPVEVVSSTVLRNLEHKPASDPLNNLLRSICQAQFSHQTGLSGTAYAYLTQLANLYDRNIIDCLQYAFDQIKARTGKTVNGTFIKD